MATLVLSTVGNALGSAIGGPIGGGLGRAAGSALGSVIDGALFGSGRKTKFVEGPRLTDVSGMTSTEGDPIPRVYGRARIGGSLIWATRPLEVANTTVERAAAPSKGASGQRTVRTAYAYFANLAVGLCEGEIAFVRRIWADGAEIDLTRVTWRLHTGTADQAADPLIVAKEGAQNAPAYRGLAYVVFEALPLADYGNRIPQFSFEVVRPCERPVPPDPRRRSHFRRGGIRPRSRRRDRRSRLRPHPEREPPPAGAHERRTRLPRRASGPVPEPAPGRRGGGVVRGRPARRPLPCRAEGRDRHQDDDGRRMERRRAYPRGGRQRVPLGRRRHPPPMAARRPMPGSGASSPNCRPVGSTWCSIPS